MNNYLSLFLSTFLVVWQVLAEQPTVEISQSFLETWESHDTSFQEITTHAIVISAFTNTTDNPRKPLEQGSNITLQFPFSQVEVIRQDGSRLIRETWQKSSIHTFALNAAGRFSFSLPVKQQDKEKWVLRSPELLVHVQGMAPESRIVIHPDHDCIDRVSKVNSQLLQTLNPRLSAQEAAHAANVIKRMMSSAKSAVPQLLTNENANVKELQSQGAYLLPNGIQGFENASLFHRVIQPVSREWSSVPIISKRSQFERRDTMNATNSTSQEWKQVQVSHKGRHIGLRIKNFFGKVLKRVVKTVKDVFMFLLRFLDFLRISISGFLKAIRNTLEWTPIGLTHRFMDHYYTLLNGNQFYSIQDAIDYGDALFQNTSNRLDSSFDQFLARFGAHDMVLTNASHFGQLTHQSVQNQYTGRGGKLEDVRVQFFHDRLYQSLMDASPGALTTIRRLGQQMTQSLDQLINSLADLVGPDVLKALHPHLLEFQNGTGIFKKTLARILNILKTAANVLETITWKVIKVLLTWFKGVNQLISATILAPLRIPFLDHIYTKYISPGSSALTIQGICLLASTVPATIAYMTIRDGEKPFSEADVRALTSVKVPQYYAYTWNTLFAETKTTNVEELGRRAGVLDWVPRMVSSWMLSVVVLVNTNPALPVAVREVWGLTTTYVISSGVIPIDQLQNTSNEALANSLDVFSGPASQNSIQKTMLMWMLPYYYGLAFRYFKSMIKIFGGTRVFLVRNWSQIYGVVGVCQVFSSAILFSLIAKKSFSKPDLGHQIADIMTYVAWNLDNLSFFTAAPYLREVEIPLLHAFHLAYQARTNFMTSFNIVGLLPNAPGSPLPKPKGMQVPLVRALSALQEARFKNVNVPDKLDQLRHAIHRHGHAKHLSSTTSFP